MLYSIHSRILLLCLLPHFLTLDSRLSSYTNFPATMKKKRKRQQHIYVAGIRRIYAMNVKIKEKKIKLSTVTATKYVTPVAMRLIVAPNPFAMSLSFSLNLCCCYFFLFLLSSSLWTGMNWARQCNKKNSALVSVFHLFMLLESVNATRRRTHIFKDDNLSIQQNQFAVEN